MTSRSPFLMLILLVGIVGIVGPGCDKSAKSGGSQETSADMGADASSADAAAAGPTITYEKGPKPTPDTVVARAGDVTVTWDDYQHAIRIGRLFSPTGADGQTEKLEPETLAMAHMQAMMTRSLLSRKLVTRELARRDITITDDEIKKSMQANDRLNRWAQHWDEPEKMTAELTKLGLSIDDFVRVGREQVAQERLADILVEEIDDEDLWKAYRYENDTVQIIGASVLNVPSSEELDTFVETRGDEINAYYKANEGNYQYPARAEATVLTGESRDDVDRKTLEKAADALAKEGADPEKIAADLGLVARPRKLFTNTEDEKIFDAKIGEGGLTFDSPRGSYAWRKTATMPPSVRELSFGLKREIAATLFRSKEISKEASEKLVAARDKLAALELDFGSVEREQVEPVLAELREMGLQANLTPDFPRAQNGFVPGFGINEPVAAAVFETSKKEPFPPGPVLSRDRVFTFRLVGRNQPTRAQFKKDRDAFMQGFKLRAKQGAVDRYIETVLEKTPAEFDLKPVKVVYGQIRKAR